MPLCRARDHHGHIITMAGLYGGLVLLLLVSSCIISIDGAAIAVINNSGRTLDAECGEFRGMIHPGERVTVRAAPADLDSTDDNSGPQGGEGGIMMYLHRYLLDWNKGTSSSTANGHIEHDDGDGGDLRSNNSDRRRPWQQTCRVEAGNCFLAWDLPLHGDRHGHEQQRQVDDDPMLGAEFEAMLDDMFDQVWHIDGTGVIMHHGGMHYSSIAGSTMGSLIGDEYQMMWRKTNQLFSSPEHCMCAAGPSSALGRAFYSLILYFTSTT